MRTRCAFRYGETTLELWFGTGLDEDRSRLQIATLLLNGMLAACHRSLTIEEAMVSEFQTFLEAAEGTICLPGHGLHVQQLRRNFLRDTIKLVLDVLNAAQDALEPKQFMLVLYLSVKDGEEHSKLFSQAQRLLQQRLAAVA